MAEIDRANFFQLDAMDIDSLEQQLHVEGTVFHRVVMSALPRGKRYKPLVSEHGSYYAACMRARSNALQVWYQKEPN